MREERPAHTRTLAERALERSTRAYSFASLGSYSLKQRLLIRAADLGGFIVLKLIGATVRFEVRGRENWASASTGGKIPIYTSWHNRELISTYFWRGRGIVVMTSKSFDGEYIARLIQRFGYGAARGSSTRGGRGAMVELIHLVRGGCPAGFTIDGPRGPRYVAKMGAVWLAKKTGQPILPFLITAARFWEAKKSWDRFQVPKPFSKALVNIAAPIYVPPDADQELLAAKRDELQCALDELNRQGKLWRSGISSL